MGRPPTLGKSVRRWCYTCIPAGIIKPKWLGKNGTRIPSWPNTITRSKRTEAKVAACLKRAIAAHGSDSKHRHAPEEPQPTASDYCPDPHRPSPSWDMAMTTTHPAIPNTHSDPVSPSRIRGGTSRSDQGEEVKPCMPDIEDIAGSDTTNEPGCTEGGTSRSWEICAARSPLGEGNHACLRCRRMINVMERPGKHSQSGERSGSDTRDKKKIRDWLCPKLKKTPEFTEEELAKLLKSAKAPQTFDPGSFSLYGLPRLDQDNFPSPKGGASNSDGIKTRSTSFQRWIQSEIIEDPPFPDLSQSRCSRHPSRDWMKCALRNPAGEGNNPCLKCGKVISVVGILRWPHIPLGESSEESNGMGNGDQGAYQTKQFFCPYGIKRISDFDDEDMDISPAPLAGTTGTDGVAQDESMEDFAGTSWWGNGGPDQFLGTNSSERLWAPRRK